MDVVAVSQTVAGLLASGAARELGQEAGGGLVAGIVARVRKVFGSDARSVDALEQARRDGGQAAVAELASALAWYARRDQEFARELAGWAAQAGSGGVTQEVHAGRDAYTAGRDQTIVNYRPGDAWPGHVSPALAFDLGVALSEKKSLHALAVIAFGSTGKRAAYVGKRDIMLNERMRAILQDFGWEMDIDDPNFDTALAGRISSLSPEYKKACRIGELVPLYSHSLLVTLLKPRSDGGLALTVTEFTRDKKRELMKEILDLEAEQKSLSIGRADLATRFFREWLNFEGERTYEAWSEDWERLIHQMHEQMVAASTV